MARSRRHQKAITLAEKTYTVVHAEGMLYMSIKEICEALGLDRGAQIRRINRNSSLREELCPIDMKTAGGPQKPNCLPIEKIVLWLEDVQIEKIAQETWLNIQDFLQALRSQTWSHPEQRELPFSLETEAAWPSPGMSLILENTREVAQTITITVPQRVQDFLVPANEGDLAITESILSKKESWILDQTNSLHFLASNQLQVHLVPQTQGDQVLNLADALQQIHHLGESTVFTARIVAGLYNIRHLEGNLVQNRAAISLEEIMLWRGFSTLLSVDTEFPSTQALSRKQERNYKEQIYFDLVALQSFHLEGQHVIHDRQGIPHQLVFKGPYLIIELIKDSTSTEDINALMCYCQYGLWANAIGALDIDNFARVDQRIFALNVQQDMLAIRIAMYLTELWRRQALLKKNHQEPILMAELLEQSLITIDKKNLTSRFAPRIEAALSKLYACHILGEAPRCLSLVDTSKNWGNAWLNSWWLLPPPFETIDYYQQRKAQQQPLYLREPTSRKRLHRKRGE